MIYISSIIISNMNPFQEEVGFNTCTRNERISLVLPPFQSL